MLAFRENSVLVLVIESGAFNAEERDFPPRLLISTPEREGRRGLEPHQPPVRLPLCRDQG